MYQLNPWQKVAQVLVEVLELLELLEPLLPESLLLFLEWLGLELLALL